MCGGNRVVNPARPWKVVYSKESLKDGIKISRSHLKERVYELIDIISKDPYANPPSYEKLAGELKGLISRRINIQHRLVYKVFEEDRTIMIARMWTHYE